MALNAIGVQTLTVSTSAVSLTLPTYTPGASHALLQNSSANTVRWTMDGTTPSATVGQQLIGGATLSFMEPWSTYGLRFFKAIREGASDGTLQIAYFSE